MKQYAIAAQAACRDAFYTCDISPPSVVMVTCDPPQKLGFYDETNCHFADKLEGVLQWVNQAKFVLFAVNTELNSSNTFSNAILKQDVKLHFRLRCQKLINNGHLLGIERYRQSTLARLWQGKPTIVALQFQSPLPLVTRLPSDEAIEANVQAIYQKNFTPRLMALFERDYPIDI